MEENGIKVPMDVIANIVFKQTVEIEVLRGQLAQARQLIDGLRHDLTKKQPDDSKKET